MESRCLLLLGALVACGPAADEASPPPGPTAPPPVGPQLVLDGNRGAWGVAAAGSGSAEAPRPTMLVLDNGSTKVAELKLSRGGDPGRLELEVGGTRTIAVHPDATRYDHVEITHGNETVKVQVGSTPTVLYSVDAARSYRVGTQEYGVGLVGAASREYRGAIAHALPAIDHVFERLPEQVEVQQLQMAASRTNLERIDEPPVACELTKELRTCRVDKRLRVSRRGTVSAKTAALLVDLAGRDERSISVDGVDVAKASAPTWLVVDEGIHTVAVRRDGKVVDQVKKMLEGDREYVFAPQGMIAYRVESKIYGEPDALSRRMKELGFVPGPPPPVWLGGVRFLLVNGAILFEPFPETISVSRFQSGATVHRLVRAGASGRVAPRAAQVKALLDKLAKEQPDAAKRLSERIDLAYADECDAVAIAAQAKVPHDVREPVAQRCPQ